MELFAFICSNRAPNATSRLATITEQISLNNLQVFMPRRKERHPPKQPDALDLQSEVHANFLPSVAHCATKFASTSF